MANYFMKEVFQKVIIDKSILDYVQIFLNIVVCVSGSIFGLYQYYKNKKFSKIIKAVELSYFYKEHILSNSTLINIILSDAGILNIINEIDKTNVHTFTFNELTNNVDDSDKILFLKGYKDSTNFIPVLLSTCESNDDFRLSGVRFDTKKSKKVAKVNRLKVLNCYNSVIDGVLNDLEYFSAAFVKGIADSDSVYQMLHQSYIETVEMLYFEICIRNNKMEDDMFYTNVIILYNLWKNKTISIKKNLQKNNNKNFNILVKKEKNKFKGGKNGSNVYV